MRGGVIEIGRLMRGAERPVHPLGPGRYVVAGTHGLRHVDLGADVPCYCEDAYYRGRERVGPCLHEIAARLQAREPTYVYALALVLEQRATALEDAA